MKQSFNLSRLIEIKKESLSGTLKKKSYLWGDNSTMGNLFELIKTELFRLMRNSE